MIKIIIAVAIFILIFYLYSLRCKCNGHCPKGKLFTSAKLWLDHLLYTRLVIMGILEDRNDLKENLARLMKNQEDIALLFGKEAPAVEKLLKEHITLAGKVVGDVKTSSPGTNADIKALYANADQIGNYLDSKAGGKEFKHHMRMHIDTLLAMAKDEFAKKDAVKSTDEYTTAGMKMAFDMARLF
jgi:hypothetical protein